MKNTTTGNEKKDNVVSIQETTKKFKVHLIVSYAIIATGLLMAFTGEENSTVVTIGESLLLGGATIWIVARIKLWLSPG